MSNEIEHNEKITVHFPKSVCNPIPNSHFGGFVSQERRKVVRFYVGGINKDVSSEDGMRSFLNENGICFTFLRYFDKSMRKTASAQLNIDARDEHIVRDPTFWPYGVFIRDWMPWTVFRNSKNETYKSGN